MQRVFSILLLLFITLSCSNKKEKLILGSSNGSSNHVLIVMDPAEWKGAVGDSIRNIIRQPILGLPQPENQFKVSQVSTKDFDELFRNTRNILYIDLGKNTDFRTKKDVYATPQKIVQITGVTEKDLLAEISKHKKDIVQEFKKSDIKVIQNNFRKESLWKDAELKTLENLNIELEIPRKYRLVEDSGDFLWMRRTYTKGTMNLLVYSYPISNEDDLNGENITKFRDSIGQKYIPGTKEGSYMITEAAYTPHTFEVTLDGKKTYETKGKWELFNDFLAGPFINYTVLDKANNRIIVVEGFTVAPMSEKRDQMFELEAILKTLKIK
ncbi:DUF4837 family protein [Aureivirga sp. CE67]|uniref:DUF4837 family protein n=1 Tax=Aureivirga sp. CE67 TaxID=1788983 RepID=UPI0018CBBB94|nr:DUF4837 family protein [Aureivirga sp. CE67]